MNVMLSEKSRRIIVKYIIPTMEFFVFFSFRRLLVLNVEPCRPATCYFICWIRILCSQQINDDDDDDDDDDMLCCVVAL